MNPSIGIMLKKQLCTAIATHGSNVLGLFAPLIIPPLHISFIYYFWSDFAREVDKHFCSCSCWDTVFKGSYESGVASYKHLYFNATSSSLKIWMTIVFGIIIFYETVKHLTTLAFQNNLRWRMFILFISAVFSHYYSWWVYINYWNDEFYSQWYHQFFFSLTELFSTILVIHLADKRNPITRRKAFGIISIALLHILAGSWDQFVTNVIKGEGYAHQIVRDLGFMIPDILHVIIPTCSFEFKSGYSLPGISIRDADLRLDLLLFFGTIFVGLCLCSIL
ncbi:uncharacterized protein LOC106643924 [Copidosoma floridanum]|uniref:uncharacterized protein LOC106643924 n=1 Tax=Copidosoma floridanum TaxID=29053 RepID=UPI0006C97154|nr:uncharacterized protein LOC106643924 [Copidosoma floridanum]